MWYTTSTPTTLRRAQGRPGLHQPDHRCQRRYYPYGGVRWSSGTLPTEYGFTGQRWEAGLGLYYYRARWYYPALGRFISADTIVPNPGNPQDLNRYAYAANNPLIYIDPSGHVACLDEECNWVENPATGEIAWRGPLPQDPLTNAQWEISKRAADTFGLPPELVAGTVAVEIQWRL